MRGRKGIGERRGRETYREKRKNKRKGNFERHPWKDHRREKKEWRKRKRKAKGRTENGKGG